MVNNMFTSVDGWILLLTILVDLATSFIILFGAFSRRIHALPVSCKIGLAALAFGLFSESGLNIDFILTGADILSDSLPFWLMQDFGTLLVILHFFVIKR